MKKSCNGRLREEIFRVTFLSYDLILYCEISVRGQKGNWGETKLFMISLLWSATQTINILANYCGKIQYKFGPPQVKQDLTSNVTERGYDLELSLPCRNELLALVVKQSARVDTN